MQTVRKEYHFKLILGEKYVPAKLIYALSQNYKIDALRMKTRKLAVFSIIVIVAVILVLFSYWQLCLVQPRPNLRVYLDLSYRNTGQSGLVEDSRIDFTMPANSPVIFSYAIENWGASPLHNVAIHFDEISDRLSLVDHAGEPYPIPFYVNIGTLNQSVNAWYGAILKTPTEKGSYEMQCHVTSDEISYAFRIIIAIPDISAPSTSK